MSHSDAHRYFTRRRVLAATGVAGAGAGVAGVAVLRSMGPAGPDPAGSGTKEAASCVLTPEATEGPFHIDAARFRSSIVEDRRGTRLNLVLGVQNAGTCRPIRGATVEIWHADAQGLYSGFDAGAAGSAPAPGADGGGPPAGGPPPGGGGQSPSSPTRYLRGAQRTNRNGLVTFRTIYPGWYEGRAPHIHVMVHVAGEEVHTGQIFFSDAANATVYRQGVYAPRGQASTTNGSDGIFEDAGGDRAIPAMRRSGAGYVGRLTMGVRV